MQVSLNWLKKWVDLSSLEKSTKPSVPSLKVGLLGAVTPLAMPVDRLVDEPGDAPIGLQVLAEKITALLTQGGIEVESFRVLSEGLEQVVVAEIQEKKPHPQADRLSLCTVQADQSYQIVCGAQNMKVGDRVALAKIGAKLPNGLAIQQSTIRGMVSQGMLCSLQELGLTDQVLQQLQQPALESGGAPAANPGPGILLLPPQTPLALPLAVVLELEEVVFEVKPTPNRGDCLSHLGIARELAAMLRGVSLKTPFPDAPSARETEDFSWETQTEEVTGEANGESSGEATRSVLQFFALAMEAVRVGPSPAWLVRDLERVGVKSINNVVDATQWLMRDTGQPTHAYDLAKIQGKVQVRLASLGEQVSLLEGTECKCRGGELLVVDQTQVLSLAGVMGGVTSAVSEQTQTLWLECAQFLPQAVRRSSRSVGVKTEASLRFERGVDPAGVLPSLERLVHLLIALTGGRVVGPLKRWVAPCAAPQVAIECEVEFFQRFLGFASNRDDSAPSGASQQQQQQEEEEEEAATASVSLSVSDCREILQRQGCEVGEVGEVSVRAATTIGSAARVWRVLPPSHRADLRLAVDLAEEVIRAVGYERLPATLPGWQTPHSVLQGGCSGEVALERLAKESLVKSGFYETVHLPFLSSADLKKFQIPAEVRIQNPLSEEQEWMAPSLLPGLLHTAMHHVRHHFGSEPLGIRLFELRPTFSLAKTVASAQKELEKAGDAPDLRRAETGIAQRQRLAFVLAGPQFAQGLRIQRGESRFEDLRVVVETLFQDLRVKGAVKMEWSGGQSSEQVSRHLGQHLGQQFCHPGQLASFSLGSTTLGFLGLIHPLLAFKLKLKIPLFLGELDWDGLAGFAQKALKPRIFQPWSEFPSMERDFALLVPVHLPAEKLCQLALKVGKPLVKSAQIFDIYQGSQIAEGQKSLALRLQFAAPSRSLLEAEVSQLSEQIVKRWRQECGAELR